MQPKVIRGLVWSVVVVVFGVGSVLTGAGVAQGDDYFTTSFAPLRSDSAALVTREIDVEGRRPTDPQNDPGDLARVRIQVRNVDRDTPVFVGIAKRADVERFLRGTTYDEMASFRLDPLRVEWRRHVGRVEGPAPREHSLWAARSEPSGSGTAEVQWDKTSGEWMAVVMNADGSPGLDVRANVGLRFGFLLPLGGTLLLLSCAAGIMLISTRHRRRRPGRAPATYAR